MTLRYSRRISNHALGEMMKQYHFTLVLEEGFSFETVQDTLDELPRVWQPKRVGDRIMGGFMLRNPVSTYHKDRFLDVLMQDGLLDGMRLSLVSATYYNVSLQGVAPYVVGKPADIWSSDGSDNCNLSERIVCDPQMKTITLSVQIFKGSSLSARRETFFNLQREVEELLVMAARAHQQLWQYLNLWQSTAVKRLR